MQIFHNLFIVPMQVQPQLSTQTRAFFPLPLFVSGKCPLRKMKYFQVKSIKMGYQLKKFILLSYTNISILFHVKFKDFLQAMPIRGDPKNKQFLSQLAL